MGAMLVDAIREEGVGGACAWRVEWRGAGGEEVREGGEGMKYCERRV